MNTVATFRESVYNQEPIHFEVKPGSTIEDFLKMNNLWDRLFEDPIVVILNGRELMQVQYNTIVREGDIIELQQFPRGYAAVAKFLYWAYIVFTVVAAIYIITMPEPGLPETADIKEGSPTYSLNARGNRYRPGTKGPILYGTIRIVPDFDQPAFSTYDANNDQTLHMLFRITQGEANVNIPSITFEDTPLSNFQGVTTEVVLPGQIPTLFPLGVFTSNDMNNIELLDPPTAAYVANDVGTKINKIGIDVTSPGLGDQNRTSGEIMAYEVRFLIQAQLINDANTPIGAWVTLGTGVLSGDSRDAIRRTFEYEVALGRYQVRLDRTTVKNTSQYVQDNVYWAGLKGYIHDPDNISPCTRLAISVRASEQIGNRSLTDMSLIASRKLRMWTPEGGWDDDLTLTNSIPWAMADLCRADYAGNRSDTNYDLPRLKQLDTQLTPLGHEFNAYFDTAGVSVWEALVKVGTCGRITPIDRAGFYMFVRDEQKGVAVQAFTMRNILKNSFRIEHNPVLEETADSILIKIQDKANDYREREIVCALPDSTTVNPRIIQLFGVTDATRAKELGMFMAATNRYRRKLTPFDTGIEGRIPMYGDKVALSHILLGQEGTKQVSGDIVSYDGVDVIRVSEQIRDGYFDNPHIVMIDLMGEPMSPCPITFIDEWTWRVGGSPEWGEIIFEPGAKKPMFIIGNGVEYVTYSKITSIVREGDTVRIESFVDDVRPYLFGDDVVPPDPEVIPPPQSAAPILTELLAHVGGSPDEPVVTLTWKLQNADRTDVQYSTDGGATYVAVGSGFTFDNRIQHRPKPGALRYRLAAVNLFRGPWVSVVVDTSSAAFNPPLDPTNLRLRESFTGPILKVQWDSDSVRHIIQVRRGGTLIQTFTVDGTTWDLSGVDAQLFNAGRAFNLRVYAVGQNGQPSTGFTTLDVSNPAPPILNNLSVVSFYGQAGVNFDFPTAVTDLAGISVWKSNSNGFSPSNTTLVVDRTRNPVIGVPVQESEVAYIRVATVDVWGTDGLNYSGQYTITGKGVDLSPIYAELELLEDDLKNVEEDLGQAEADLGALEEKFPIKTTDISDDAISTPKLQANSVTAEKIVALSITAEKIVALTITGDKIAANSISADKLVANTITAGQIAALTITAGQIAAGTITVDKLNVANLSAISANMGTLTAGLMKTTSSGTEARLEIDSNGSFPLWIGANEKNATNGQVFYDKTSQLFAIRDPASGRRFEFQPSSGMPLWYGAGTKSESNGLMYFSTALARLVVRNLQIESAYVTTLESNLWAGGTQGFKLFADGSAEFRNLVISRPNVVAQGTLNLPSSSLVSAHFGNWRSQLTSLASTFFASRYNEPLYGQDPDNIWYEVRPAGAGFGFDGYYEFKINIPTSTFNPDEVGVVNGRMLVAQAVVVNSDYFYSGAAPEYGYETPCTAMVTRVANYGASGSYIQLRIQVPVPFNRHPRITGIQIRSINWALSAFT